MPRTTAASHCAANSCWDDGLRMFEFGRDVAQSTEHVGTGCPPVRRDKLSASVCSLGEHTTVRPLLYEGRRCRRVLFSKASWPPPTGGHHGDRCRWRSARGSPARRSRAPAAGFATSPGVQVGWGVRPLRITCRSGRRDPMGDIEIAITVAGAIGTPPRWPEGPGEIRHVPPSSSPVRPPEVTMRRRSRRARTAGDVAQDAA